MRPTVATWELIHKIVRNLGRGWGVDASGLQDLGHYAGLASGPDDMRRSEEHTSELQSQFHLVCRLLLEKKNGIDAAQEAGLRIKINAVALRGVNDMEFDELIRWTHGRGMDLVLIEVMPLGDLGENARLD